MSRRKKDNYRRSGGYFTFDRGVYRSQQFLRLKKIERLALIHLISYRIPYQREEIAMSSRRLAKEIGVNKDSAAQALKGLVQAEFIQIVDESSWFDGKSRSYRLTFTPCFGRPPTDEWARHQIEGPDLADHLSDTKGHPEHIGLRVALKRLKS